MPIKGTGSKKKDKDTKKRKQEAEEEEDGGERQEEIEMNKFAVNPPNGGWGWLIVFCAFYCNVVLDGIQLTFGVFLSSISISFDAELFSIALAGSLMFGIHLLMGPVCGAFSSVFGLRPVTIAGSLISCVGISLSYFATSKWYLYMTFGVIGGVGLGLVYMNSLIITSVYFTSLMPIAMGIVVCGTGVGTVVFAIMGDELLKYTTWQNSFLLEGILAGSMAIAASTFRPLKPVRVELSPRPSDSDTVDYDEDYNIMTPTRSLFVKGEMLSKPPSFINSTKVQSLIWNYAEDAVIEDRKQKKRKWLCSIFKKKKKKQEVEETNVVVLQQVRRNSITPVQQRSQADKSETEEEEPKIYSLAQPTSTKSPLTIYTRIDSPKEQKRISTSLKRALRGMVDCHLLKSCSFFMFTLSGALQIAGFIIVLIYEKDRCVAMGFSEEFSVYFIICLGASNMLWRLILGGIGSIPKVNYKIISVASVILEGIVTVASGFSTNVYYQFIYCFLFGFGVASFAVFRIVLLIDLLGPDVTQNATGINLLFMGIFSIISPPFFGWIMDMTNNFNVIFVTTGLFIILSGILLASAFKVKKTNS